MYTSGNDWSQCMGVCPMPTSPHYNAPVDKPFTIEELANILNKVTDLDDLIFNRLFSAAERNALSNQSSNATISLSKPKFFSKIRTRGSRVKFPNHKGK